MNPADKRLAIQVEDHSLEYGHFEGTIPEGEYGAGGVIIWDKGTYEPIGDMEEMVERGVISFHLQGNRLSGEFSLVRLKKGTGKGNLGVRLALVQFTFEEENGGQENLWGQV